MALVVARQKREDRDRSSVLLDLFCLTRSLVRPPSAEFSALHSIVPGFATLLHFLVRLSANLTPLETYEFVESLTLDLDSHIFCYKMFVRVSHSAYPKLTTIVARAAGTHGRGVKVHLDTVDKVTRSRIMKAVRQSGTTPERKLGRALHSLGYRYRIAPKTLAGRPDFVLPKYKVAIFVHGCFWHRHNCARATTPKSNLDYWLPKFQANIERDARKHRQLKADNWRIATVWECAVMDCDDHVFKARLSALSDWIRHGHGDLELPTD